MKNCMRYIKEDNKLCDKPPVFARLVTSEDGFTYYIEVCQSHRKEIDKQP